MKHDRIVGSWKMANLSGVAETGKVLSHYDVKEVIAQHLQEVNQRFSQSTRF